MYVFLDDIRHPRDVTWCEIPRGVEWVIVRSWQEFFDLLYQGLDEIEYVSFDHDLADAHYAGDVSEKTGYHCAMSLVRACLDEGVKLPRYGVHSMNQVGRDRIVACMENAKSRLGL